MSAPHETPRDGTPPGRTPPGAAARAHFRRVDALLDAALDRDPADRAAFVDALAADDPALGAEVRALVRAEAEAGAFLEGPPLADPIQARLQRTLAGRYVLQRRIGSGGMARVYLADDLRHGRRVAVKAVALPSDAADAGAGVTVGGATSAARFLAEVRVMARLQHPHLLPLFDSGEADGVPYLVMPYVEGGTLRQLLAAEGPLPVAEAVRLARAVAGALAHAHAAGVVHRDLKPDNILLRDGEPLVADFGIAVARAGGTRLTRTGVALGTPQYMAPEQAAGEAVDARADVYALGAILYEMLAGCPPHVAGDARVLLAKVLTEPATPVRLLRPAVPAAVSDAVDRAVAKDPADRYPSAAALSAALAAADMVAAPTPAAGARARGGRGRFELAARRPAVAAIALVVLGGAAGLWAFRRSERRHWARERAIPDALAIEADRPLVAFNLLREARRLLPNDTALARRLAERTRLVSVGSSPAGATVEIRDYLAGAGDDWQRLGTTPIGSAAMPNGYFRWRLTAPGTAPVVTAPTTEARMHFALDSARTAPAGMVYAPATTWANYIDFVGWAGPYALPPFYVDRREVTNADYQRFVDAGGYERAAYWTEPFVDGGRALARDAAMARLHDSTGRAGPSTWTGGHYRGGRGAYPVAGVSWYEAAAYAAWAGKSLPAMAQWYDAAPPDAASFTVRASNISRDAVAPAGAFDGVGPFGTVDMAGNVKEWVVNTLTSDRRLVLGGAWASPSYLYSEPEALSPWDRAATNGFRCVRNLGPLPPAALAPIRPLARDFSTVVPAPDPVFRAYRALYAYDDGPLHARVEGATDAPDWRREQVTFDAAYGGARVTAYLFLPKHVRPPFQTVVFFPSARVLDLPNSAALGDTSFFDYVVQSGRAVVYPVYSGTYERRLRTAYPGAGMGLTLTVERFKDLARALDYLATRADVDTTRLAYLGVSMGAAEGVIYTTLLQDRLKTDVLLDGGFFLGRPSIGQDQADFAPRLRLPVLMVNGRYDYAFPPQSSQDPLFRMLGAPAARKRHVVLDTPHDVGSRRAELTSAVLAWLDQYLGPVRAR